MDTQYKKYIFVSLLFIYRVKGSFAAYTPEEGESFLSETSGQPCELYHLKLFCKSVNYMLVLDYAKFCIQQFNNFVFDHLINFTYIHRISVPLKSNSGGTTYT